MQWKQAMPRCMLVSMNIFVTGATGWVGSVVVKELREAGHTVLGLAHSDTSATKLEALGVKVHRGSLYDFDSLAAGAAATEAVIHTAFNHDFSTWKDNCEQDRSVIAALGGKTRKIIITSATAVIRGGAEDSPLNTHNPRVATEEAAIALAATGVHVSIVRLAASVHAEGDPHFVTTLIKLARAKGAAAYIEEGNNRWPAVHRLDTGPLYRLVLEKGMAGGRYHAVAEEGIPFRELATVIGQKLGVPVKRVSKDEAAAHFGGFAHFAAMDASATSARTRSELGWAPKQPGLLADLENGKYFT